MPQAAPFDFSAAVAYDEDAKRRFHAAGRRQLRRLAIALGLHGFDLRSNPAGFAVSGEITLHGDHLYVQVSQSALGPRHGVLFRACKNRRDFVGGANHFAPVALLNHPHDLARKIRETIHV